jgi:hypothetical protein
MIYYDYKKQLSPQECLESLHKTFGDSCVSRATVYNWFAEFNHGTYHFEDEPRAGRPRTAVTPETSKLSASWSIMIHISPTKK